MQAQMETAAQKYRRLKKEKEVVQDATCPDCGMVWKARKADLNFWVASGMIPSSLAAVMVNAVKKKGMSEQDIMAGLDIHQLAQSVEFTSNMVRYTAVEPRIIDKAEGANDIEPDEVMMCCYNFLRDWQMQGGGRAATLETFRSE
jgi:hypothetical protein